MMDLGASAEIEERVSMQLRNEVDPSNKYGARKIFAALRSMGLEPEEVDPESSKNVSVTDLIPVKERKEKIKAQRIEIWEGLRQQRLRELKSTLEGHNADDTRRFERTGDGIRAVVEADIPPAGELKGMGNFEEMQAKVYAKIKAEQQRKANTLATGFLQEKKRMEIADAKIEAMNARLKEYKAQQDAAIKAKRAAALKGQEKRQSQVERAAQERAAWEQEMEESAAERLAKARAARAHHYSKENLAAKLEAASQKRHVAFQKAAELEQRLVQKITDQQESLNERLEERRQEVEEKLRRQAEASQARFQNRQVKICAQQQEFVENTLEKHNTFKENHQRRHDEGRANLKARSKSCGDITRKAHDKWRQGFDRIQAATNESNDDMMERQRLAWERVQERRAQGLKCDNDVHSFREVKHQTWGELQRRRVTEYTKSHEAKTQALAFDLAERKAKVEHEAAGKYEMDRRRQQISKETLALNDRARAGFIKIQCEPDERKIVQMMEDLGFEMPKLPKADDEEGAEKPAF